MIFFIHIICRIGFGLLSHNQTESASIQPLRVEGSTMGTTYHIIYFDDRNRNFKTSIDSLLKQVNQSINTYDPLSEVSVFNASKRGIAVRLPHLYTILQKSEDVYESSHGAFDPTVMPLVNAWGFGPGKEFQLMQEHIDSIRAFVGFDKIILRNDSILKKDPRVQLDFGGIGQGYGVDVIKEFLISKGIVNMLIELGGEGIAVGKNLQKNRKWEIGITDPASTLESQFLKAYVSLNDQSFTTAGNYFNYKIRGDKKFGHIIDPVTGYPVQHELLSASIFASDCTTADAWDTAFMVMGFEKSKVQLQQMPELQALLIYSTPQGNTDTYITPVLKPFVRLEQ